MAGDIKGIYYVVTHALPYLAVTIIIHKIIAVLYNIRFLRDRIKLSQQQRHVYFEKLSIISAEMEAENSKDENMKIRKIQELKSQHAEFRNKLDVNCNDDDTPERLQNELRSLERDKKELLMFQREMLEYDVRDNIDEKIKELQLDN